MSIFVFDLVERQSVFLKGQTVSQTTSLAETLAANSTSWVLASDFIGLDEVIHSQSKYPGLLYAMVVDKDGCILGHTDASMVKKYLNDSISLHLLHTQPREIILLNNSKLVDVAVPVLANGQHIGWARVSISHQRLLDNLKLITRDGLIYTVFAIIAGSIFAFFMARRLTGGLQHIVGIAERVSHGELHLRSQLNRIDELGTLSKDFDSMLDSLQQRGEELRQAQDERMIQQSKMAAIGEMIGAIAHQWRQPLNAISLIVMDLKDAYEFGEFSKDYLFNSAQKTMEQIKYMSSTIDDFRNFFKPSKEKVVFKLNTTIKEVISLVHDQLLKANINIAMVCKYGAVSKPSEERYSEICTCEPELMCYGYPNEFKQVIINIFGNSRDAIVKNRQRYAMDAKESGEILVALSKIDNHAILEIKDNGGGISEDIIDKIFDSYYTTKGDEGTGMGLYMSKIIIEQNMNGRIYVSNIEKGAVFTIELPLDSVDSC
ncbi:MAG: HAMP domain-containing protein [Nitrospirae bacterium]|nr:HAMP domain-containing protein [Nitrospirota bacterium]